MRKQKGFTLIELLVVIAIIGLLSTLAVVSLNNARQKSRDAKRISDIKQVQTALELYFNDQNGYPTQEGALGSGNLDCLDDTAGGFVATCTTTGTVYMTQVPENPTPVDSGGDYNYDVNGAGDTYSIRYYIADDTGNVTGGTWNTACAAGISGCNGQ